jgi:glycerophosphoryl diester phosphodiesterase
MKRLVLLVGAAIGMLGNVASAQWLVAHRGASFDAPENTLAAVREAVKQGADGIEMDYYLTSDGKIICIHDGDTKRTAGDKLVIGKTPFDKLRSLEVGSWKGQKWRGEQMPTLDEVLAAMPPGTKPVIELKVGPEIVKPMAEAIARSSISPEDVIIISFNAATIAECERLVPQYRTHWLSGYKEHDDGRVTPTAADVLTNMKRTKADGFGSQARPDHFNAAFIEELRRGGVDEFHVWTIDDAKTAKLYRDLGAKWITTNRPGWLREQLAKEPAAEAAAAK